MAGIPGEEDIRVVEAISRSSARYVLTRHEQGTSFMAGTCGWLTGRAAALLPAAGTVLTGVGESGRRRADRWPS